MTPGPDRDPRALAHPDLKIAPGMLDAFDAALDLAARYPSVITARIIDADTLLEPRTLPQRKPRNIVEIFIDTTGVLIVATGREWDVPLYVRACPLPASSGALAVRSVRALLFLYVTCAMAALGRQVSPGLPGTAGT